MNRFLLVVVAFILLASCKDKDKALKPNITGRAGEVLIVMDEAMKKDSAGIYLMGLFGQSYLGLPQDEPVFDILTTPPSYFDKQTVLNHKYPESTQMNQLLVYPTTIVNVVQTQRQYL